MRVRSYITVGVIEQKDMVNSGVRVALGGGGVGLGPRPLLNVRTVTRVYSMPKPDIGVLILPSSYKCDRAHAHF
jgi:hypothetical protein